MCEAGVHSSVFNCDELVSKTSLPSRRQLYLYIYMTESTMCSHTGGSTPAYIHGFSHPVTGMPYGRRAFGSTAFGLEPVWLDSVLFCLVAFARTADWASSKV
jgi:hypothetical protein